MHYLIPPKSLASVAATLTILSYMATAVISASEAMNYVHELWDKWPIIWATIGLLLLSMGITIMGIGESSKVAVVIFIFHITSLILLASFCGLYLMQNGLDVFASNNSTPTENGVVKALFFGFCAAMLGISGFESSANFVEEQQRGVFRKTLRNMWIVASIFNPLMAFLALAIIPIPQVADHQAALLSHMGFLAGGNWPSLLISVDAALVLSGAVLTSFVGVGGLVERMTLDRILPPFLLKRTKKGTTYLISITFFLLCNSILLITSGDLGALASVYTIAFLLVMVLFGLGNILLKVRRKNLPRPERSSWITLLIAIIMVAAAIFGNAVMNPSYMGVFFKYFVPTMLIVVVMLNRIFLLELLLTLIKYFFKPVEKWVRRSNRVIVRAINRINVQEFVFFTKDDDVSTLNKVMLYIKRNEHTRKLRIATVTAEGEKLSESLLRDIDVLDRVYPEIKIDFIQVHGDFNPALIHHFQRVEDPCKLHVYRLSN